MKPSLRIAIAEDDPTTQEFYRLALADLGHQVVGVVATGAGLVELCRNEKPDLVITDIRLENRDEGIEAAHEVSRERPVPLIVVSGHVEPPFLDQALNNQVLAYLVKPVREADLEPAIALAMRRFAEFEALHNESTNLRQALEDRKLIERAKGIIMKRAGLNEESAFRRLQKMAMDKNRKLAEIALMILTTEETLEVPDPG